MISYETCEAQHFCHRKISNFFLRRIILSCCLSILTFIFSNNILKLSGAAIFKKLSMICCNPLENQKHGLQNILPGNNPEHEIFYSNMQMK